MKHYSQQDLTLIKDNISHNIQKLNQAVDWVESNLKYEEKYALLLKLKNALNTLSKINNNINSKPVIAIFGASQVGKSYLIKNLLSLKGRPFMIQNKDEQYDFLKDINPPGVGAESTGVVTRFTIDSEIKFADFPIRINLLSAKDLLIIVLDTFFLDLKKIAQYVTKKEFETHLEALESRQSDQNQKYLNEADVLEIKEYFEHHLSKYTFLFEGLYESRFFQRIGKIIDRFDHQQWKEVFSPLWLKNQYISDLFNKLISGLASLQFENTVYISFNDVLRGHGEILDVQRLKELNDSQKLTTVKKEDGDELSVNLSLMTALIGELIFSIPKELIQTKGFLNNSDLLDFPGARSRLAIELENINAERIPDMLLRGKVSYLFNKYSDDFNINNLLFCTNDKQLEVSEIPSLLFNWISQNIGKNANERTLSLEKSTVPPLFVIFTFFNNQLKFDSTNDFDFASDKQKLDYKWDTRFNRFFKNEIVTPGREWDVEWTKVQDNFQNLYLLRDFKYSADSFDGFEQNGYETNIKPEREIYLNRLRESFLNFGFVKDHFRNPDQSWAVSAELNQDGSELIIENLAEVSNNLTKTNHYINKVDRLINELEAELTSHLHTDDLTALRAKRMHAVNEVQFSINAMVAKDVTAFNQLVKLFSLQPVEVYNLLNENIVSDVNKQSLVNLNPSNIFLTQYAAELKGLTSREEVFEVLKPRLYLNENQQVEDYLISKGIKIDDLFIKPETTSKSKFYIDLVVDYWIAKATDSKNSQYFLDSGFTKNNLDFLISYFTGIISIRKLKSKLEGILNEVVSEIYTNHGTEEFLAETCSLIINDLVTNFDLNHFTSDEIGEIENLKQDFNFRFYNQTKSDDPSVIQQLFDNAGPDMAAGNVMVLEKYNRWIENLRISALVNCGFVNYNEQVNDSLRQIINGFDVLKLN